MASVLRSLTTKGSRLLPRTAPIVSSFQTRNYAAPAEGRTAIVTGSARGIGKSIALRLANDGYDICINDISANKQGAEEVAHEITQLGRKSTVAIGDVSVMSEVESVVQQSVNELGPLSTMVANAGIAQVKALLDLTPSDFERMFRINVFGVHNCHSTAAKQFIKQGNCTQDNPGKLLAAASIVAFKPFPLLSHYSASKYAVRGLTSSYAMELASEHITVNAYAPGIVGTAMWDLIDEELGKKKGAQKGETIKKYSQDLILLGRTSVPNDVASLVSFLSSKDSDYMTGQTICVDGGIIVS
jgi:acetoin reductase-like protein